MNSKVKNKLIFYFASRPAVANILMLIILFSGGFSFLNTKKEVFPEFSNDNVEIDTIYPGASPQDIESSIVLPIENAISGLPGIKKITSKSEEGKAIVIAELYNGEDVNLARQRIQDHVARITVFPDLAEKPIVSQNINKRGVLKVILYSNDSNQELLKYYADKLYDEFRSNPNIGPIEIKNVPDLAIYIDVSKSFLQKYKISLLDVANKINQFAFSKSGGVIETDFGDISLRFDGRRDYADDFIDIPVIETRSGKPIFLGSAANIYEGFQDNNNSARFNGKKAISLDVFRVGSLTPNQVSDAVSKYLAKFSHNLPHSVKTVIVDDRSKAFIQRANLLRENGLIGLFLVLLLLGLFMDLHLAFWVAMGIPISFFGAFLLFPVADISINMVTMFAFIMCLGIVVDDAIIVGENINCYRRKGFSPLDSAVYGSSEVAAPVTFSIITNIVAFLPLFFVPGVMGKIFIYIPAVVVSVFFISLVESFLVLPAHLSVVKNEKKSSSARLVIKTFIAKKLGRIYRRLLDFSIKQKYTVVALSTSILLITIALVVGGRMGLELFPDVESDIATATVKLVPGSSSSSLYAIEKQLLNSANKTLDFFDDKNISKGVYTSIVGDEVKARIYLVDSDNRSVSTRAIIERWRTNFSWGPGVSSMSYSVNERGPGAGPDLTIELTHSDVVSLKLAASWLADKLRSYNILSDVDDGISMGKRQFNFVLNDNAHALGITSQEVTSQVKAAFHGIDALIQHRGKDEIDVVVRLPKEERDDEQDIRNFFIHTKSGAEVRLADIVEIREGASYSKIERKNSKRVIAVTAEAYPKSALVNVQNDLESKVFQEMKSKFPGIRYSYGGKQTDINDSMSSLFVGLVLALIMMYGLLTVLFNNMIQSLIILLVVPFSFVGVVFGHLLLGYSMSVLSLFGMVALTGVVINDGVVLMRFIQDNLTKLTFTEAITEAAHRRAAPVALTSITTFVGLLPIISETSMQAQFLIPMAVSLAFGVLFAMLITLLLIPAICSILDDFDCFS
jgi:multidrug efflux pump subunit AcrB